MTPNIDCYGAVPNLNHQSEGPEEASPTGGANIASGTRWASCGLSHLD